MVAEIARSNILITGGAGFIGSHLSDALVRRSCRVRVLDNLTPQVHGEPASPPKYLNPEVELIVGDVRDASTVRRALKDVDAVCHLAAAVGVGQSMYQIGAYTDTNTMGTAVLLESLSQRPVGRLVVASSMSVYGEGLYRSATGQPAREAERSIEQLRLAQWEPRDEAGPLTPVPTPETKQPSLASIYALNKFDQEQMCLMIGRAYGMPTVALRLFNVFGTRQALSNPYTGVLAIFLSRLLNDKPPLIYEDGHQQRDFVHVGDVVQAFCLALETPNPDGAVFNIGSGQPRRILDIAHLAAEAVGKPHIRPHVTGKYRAGDIRHCFADMRQAQNELGYQPRTSLEEGLRELALWLGDQTASDGVERAFQELSARGLAV